MLCLSSSNVFAKDKEIIASIRPLQSIVANIIDGTEEVDLIIDHNESLHNYQLKPTKIRNIHNSNIIIMVDRNFEVFMNKILDSLDSNHQVIEVAKLPNIELIHSEESCHKHEHEHEHEHEHHAEYDYHLWLDIDVVKNIARGIVDILSKKYPDHQVRYEQNLAQFNLRLNALDTKIKAKLANIGSKDFIVTHNAYAYFIKRYNLHEPFVMTIDHDHNIGARSVLDIQKLIIENKVHCIFEEPQFESKIISKLQKESSIKIGKLDAEWGDDNASTQDAYFVMMDSLADSFSNCLK